MGRPSFSMASRMTYVLHRRDTLLPRTSTRCTCAGSSSLSIFSVLVSINTGSSQPTGSHWLSSARLSFQVLREIGKLIIFSDELEVRRIRVRRGLRGGRDLCVESLVAPIDINLSPSPLLISLFPYQTIRLFNARRRILTSSAHRLPQQSRRIWRRELIEYERIGLRTMSRPRSMMRLPLSPPSR